MKYTTQQWLDIGNWASKGISKSQLTVIRNDVAILNELDHIPDFFEADEEETSTVIFEWDGEVYVVGSGAENYPATRLHNTTDIRIGSKAWKALMLATIHSLSPNKSANIDLVLSLPVSLYKSGRYREVPEEIAGTYTIYVDGREFTYHLDSSMISVRPEGVGTLFYVALSSNGRRSTTTEEVLHGRTIVFDFGGHTMDVMSFSAGRKGRYNTSFPAGLINARNAVAEKIKNRYNRTSRPNGATLDNILQLGLYSHAGGDPEDVSEWVNQAMRPIRQEALCVWAEELDSGADDQFVIITGGGAPIIGPTIAMQMQHNGIIIVGEERIPEYLLHHEALSHIHFFPGPAHLAHVDGLFRFDQLKAERNA